MKAAAACLMLASLAGCMVNNDQRAREINTAVGYDPLHSRRANAEVDQVLHRNLQPVKPVPDPNRAAAANVDCSRPLPFEVRNLRCS
jgi:hypothetical protein